MSEEEQAEIYYAMTPANDHIGRQVTYPEYVMESLFPDVAPMSDWQKRYLAYLFPENPDGSRQVDDHTIMTNDAWLRMVEKVDEAIFQTTTADLPKPGVPIYWVDGGARYSIAEQDRRTVRRGRGHAMKRPQVVHPRQYGRSSAVQNQLDEWAHLWGDVDTRIDLKRLKDPDYISELKEELLKGMRDAEQ